MKIRWAIYVNQFGMRTDRVLQFCNDRGDWKEIPVVEVFKKVTTRAEKKEK